MSVNTGISKLSKLSRFAVVPYVCFFLFISAYAVLQPEYTWDLLGYIGSSVDSTDARAIHDTAFDAIRPFAAKKDIQVDNPYRADVAANPYHFAEQLPFYAIKPLYVELIKVEHRLGLPYPRAAVAISAVSNFLLAMLLWRWLSAYLSGLPLLASCTLIMLSPNVLELSRWATPDCFATVVAALGVYLLLERNLYFWGCSLLIVDIWVRTDVLVLAGVVFLVLLLRRKLDVVEFASLCLLSLGSYLAINHFSGNYGWAALFYNSFQGGLAAPGETLIHFSRSAYLHQVVRGAYLWLISGSFALYLLLGGLAIWLNRASLYTDVVAAVLGARVVSYILYPNGDQRYTAVLFVLIPVALVRAVRLCTMRGSTSMGEPHAHQDSLSGLSTPQLQPYPAISGTVAR
jgi:hypothetical protein